MEERLRSSGFVAVIKSTALINSDTKLKSLLNKEGMSLGRENVKSLESSPVF